jgi:putative ABC transport system ATP-binding protein
MSVRRGEFLIIYGTSGGGKTSLLNIMGTIDKPTKGNMRICNTRISRSTTDTELSEIRRCRLGFVFQTFNLLSSLTALENVMLPMILAGKYNRAERRQRAVQLLNRVGMGKRLDHLPSQLSGGEQQRVTIARSIANEPDILLLDEPTGDLDTVNTLIAMKLLTDLHIKDKLTLVMVTHELAHKPFADRVIWMRDGKIQTVEEIPAKKRAEAHAKLHAQFAELNLSQDMSFDGEGSPREEDEELGLTTNPLPEERKSSVAFSHTEVRKPQSYSTHHSTVKRNAGTSKSNKGKERTKGAGVYGGMSGERTPATEEVNPTTAPAYLGNRRESNGNNSPLLVLP